MVNVQYSRVISGFTSKSHGSRRNDDRSSDKSAVERRKPIRSRSVPSPVHMDRPAANGFGHVLFVARDRRVVNTGNSHVVRFHPYSRWERRRLRNDSGSFRRACPSWQSGFCFRVAGKESFSTSVQDGQENGRTRSSDERDHRGHTSDQNVHLGKTFCKAHRIREKVSASVSQNQKNRLIVTRLGYGQGRRVSGPLNTLGIHSGVRCTISERRWWGWYEKIKKILFYNRIITDIYFHGRDWLNPQNSPAGMTLGVHIERPKFIFEKHLIMSYNFELEFRLTSIKFYSLAVIYR